MLGMEKVGVCDGVIHGDSLNSFSNGADECRPMVGIELGVVEGITDGTNEGSIDGPVDGCTVGSQAKVH